MGECIHGLAFDVLCPDCEAVVGAPDAVVVNRFRLVHGPTPAPAPAPKRRWVLTLDCHADELDDLVDVLDDARRKISTGEVTSSVGGGTTRGYHWQLTEDPDMTGDRYREALTAWRDQQRGES